MSFSSDFSSAFSQAEPAIGDLIALVFYLPGSSTTVKYIGTISGFEGPETGSATHLTTDAPGFEHLKVEIAKIKANPTYKWVTEFSIAPK